MKKINKTIAGQLIGGFLLLLGVAEFLPINLLVVNNILFYITPQLLSVLSLLGLILLFYRTQNKAIVVYGLILLVIILFRFQIRLKCNYIIMGVNKDNPKRGAFFLGVKEKKKDESRVFKWKSIMQSQHVLVNIDNHPFKENIKEREEILVIDKDWYINYSKWYE